MGAPPSGSGCQPAASAAEEASSQSGIPNATAELKCPSCGHEFTFEQVAELPEQTCLTLVFQVEEGQRIQAKTLAGVVSAFDEMQKAIGAELGAETTTLIEGLETANNEVRITFRICNAPASGMEAPSGGETAKTGSTEGDSPTGVAGDAQKGAA